MFSPLSELTKGFAPSLEYSSSSSTSSTSSSKTLLISDSVGCDADFLVSHFLHAFVKAELPTIFVHAAQTFGHYGLVGAKCGVNLQAAVDKKRLVVVDAMKLVADALMGASASASGDVLEGGGGEGGSNRSGGEVLLTRLLFDAITEAVDSKSKSPDLFSPSSSSSSSSLLVLIDDVSLLSSLGVSTRRVAAFVYSLRRRLASLKGATLVVRLRNDVEGGGGDDDDDDDEIHLIKLFAHTVDAHFRVRGLSTGYCRDVHGAIDVSQRVSSSSSSSSSVDGGKTEVGDDASDQNDDDVGGRMTFLRNIEKQFKINEKGVVVFAPGLSAAVL